VAEPGAISVNPASRTTGRPLATSSAHRSGPAVRTARGKPGGAGRPVQRPPQQLRPVAHLRHLLAGRHPQLRVEPQHGGARRGRRGSGRVGELGAGHLEPGEVLGPAVERDGREDPYLRLRARDRDAGQQPRAPPLGAPRPPDDLADAGVLPVAHGPRPGAVPGRALVGQHHQHGPRGGLQRVGAGRRGGLLDPYDERQDELGRGVPLVGLDDVLAAHAPSLPAGRDRPGAGERGAAREGRAARGWRTRRFRASMRA
jgi:hypothetical protein